MPNNFDIAFSGGFEQTPLRDLMAGMDYTPTTGLALSSFQGGVFKGTGSLYEAFTAAAVESERGKLDVTGPATLYQYVRDNVIGREKGKVYETEDDYKNSSWYRKDIPYEKGMTERLAQLLAEDYDQRKGREFILSRTTTGQKIFGTASSFLTGIIEPRNAAIGLAISGGLTTLGKAAIAANRAYKLTKPLKNIAEVGKAINSTTRKARLARVSAEGAVSAGILEYGNRQSAETLGVEYTWADFLQNVVLSTAFSFGLQSGINYYSARRARNVRLSMRQSQEHIYESAVTAAAQMAEGKRVNLDMPNKIYNREAAIRAADELNLPKSYDEAIALEARQQAAGKGGESPFMDQARQIKAQLADVDVQLKATPKGQTLLQFLRSRGGLQKGYVAEGQASMLGSGGALTRNLDTGELRSIDLDNKKGMTLDKAREAAAEAGYLHEDSTVADFLDLLDQESRGNKVYSTFDAETMARQDLESTRQNYEQIGIHSGMDEAEIARTLEDISDATYAPEYDLTQTDYDNLVKDFDDWSKSDIYEPHMDDAYIDAMHDEAAGIPEEYLNGNQIDNEIAELDAEIASVKKAGFWDDVDEDELADIADIEADFDTVSKTVDYASICLTRG